MDSTKTRLFAMAMAIAAGMCAFAQLSSALPTDRFAFARGLARRGMHAEALKEFESLRTEKSLPRDEVRFHLAEEYRALSRKSEALAAYDALLKDFPGSKYVDYARLYRALLLDGEDQFKELMRLDHPGAPERVRATALYWMGQHAEKRGEAKRAVEFYDRVVQVSPTNEVAGLSRLRSAAVLSASGDAADRRRALSVYLDLSASKNRSLAEEALYFAAMVAYRDARYAEAAALFRRLTSNFPESPRAKEGRVFAAWSNHLAGRHAEALEIATALREEGNEDAGYLVAASLRALERREDAIDAYDAAMAKYPNGRHFDTEWYERLSILSSLGRHDEVLKMLSARSDPPKETADRVWSHGCEAAIATTNFTLAVQYATLTAKMTNSPLASTATHRLAWLLEKTGDNARAAVAYRALAARWPKSSASAQGLYLAGVCEVRSGRPEQASADWTSLLSRYPDSKFAPEALYSRAMLEVRKGEYRAAARSLDELLKRFPSTAKRGEALYWRGVSASAVGDAPEAERHLRAALAVEPSPEFAREVRLELAGVLFARGSNKEAAAMYAQLLSTKACERLPPVRLEWISAELAGNGDYASALKAAEILAARKIDGSWNQVAATLEGAAHEGLGERDAARSAYARALACDARTSCGARAALALGILETEAGMFDEAKEHLGDAVNRANSAENASVRVRAYSALARNEEERGDDAAALGYHMLVGTLFDDPEATPPALVSAIAILRRLGRAKEADDLAAELAKRYPKAAAKAAAERIRETDNGR